MQIINSLSRSFFTPNYVNKDDISIKLTSYANKGKLLAHLVNSRMYQSSNDIEKQNSELKVIEQIVNQQDSSIKFNEIQQFVNNSSLLFKKQLPDHFKQAIINLINSRDSEQCQEFINNLAPNSESYLKNNGVDINIRVLTTVNLEKLSREIENCLAINLEGSICEVDRALALLKKFSYQLEVDVREVFIKTLIEKYSGSGPNGEAGSDSQTVMALLMFSNQLRITTLKAIAKTLIEKYSAANQEGSACNIIYAILLLEKFGKQFDIDTYNDLVETLIENCTNINSEGHFCNASDALKILIKFGSQLENSRYQALVTALIKDCISINSSNKVHNAGIALEALKEFGSLLEVDMHNALVKTLIETYGTIDASGYFCDVKEAVKLLKIFGDKLDIAIRNGLIKTLIENCSAIGLSGYVREVHIALKLLDKYGNRLDLATHHTLVKTLIRNCISGISPCGGIRKAEAAIILVNKHKLWLSQVENYEIYRRSVNTLFDYSSNAQEINQLLENHGDVISEYKIRTKYRLTDSIRITQVIRDYVQGPGQPRNINLTSRLDMEVNGWPLAGIAFEVHNFTEGIESVALKAINDFLEILRISKPQFTTDNLRDKFNLIEDEQLRFQANNALNKILGSADYKSRLESTLPSMAAFLNLNHTTWEAHYNTEESRWSMWLSQSFGEAGSAYDTSNDTISCVKGVYERLFTGFRGMHPIIDCLFITQTVTMEFNNAITIWLSNSERAEEIVAKLKKKGLTGTEEEKDFKDKVKQAYFKTIKKDLTRLIDTSLKASFSKLRDFDELKAYLTEEVNSRRSQILNDAFKKVLVNLDHFDCIAMNEEQTLDDYLNHQLNFKPLPPLVEDN
ncbi:MAG: hypothetical protein ACK4M7_00175 [Burkholderiales bacterium]